MKKINVRVRGAPVDRQSSAGRTPSATAGAPAAQMAAEAMNSTFGFRMSKKVAELTQVVHMLFVRNHEKEIENEALRAAYEDEIAEVIADAKTRLAALEEHRQTQARRHDEESAQGERRLADARAQHDIEWRDRLTSLEGELQEVKAECGNVRDLLINAQKDIERLKHGHEREQSMKQRDLDARQNEISRMKAHISKLEHTARREENEAQRMRDVVQTNKQLGSKIAHLHKQVDSLTRDNQKLAASNKQLESASSIQRDADKSTTEKTGTRREFTGVPIAVFLDCKQETKRLREQVARFRMELSNRENNFNRMFTDKQPIVVDRGGSTRLASLRQRRSLPDMGSASRRAARKQSWASSSASLQSCPDSEDDRLGELSSAPTTLSANTGPIVAFCESSDRCLPHLPAESKTMQPRLLKPRPPRALISANASGRV